MRALLLCSLVLVACTPKPEPEPPAEDLAPYTPRWAFRPWISKDISSGSDTYAFVQGFEERDIPVGVVVLDSPWETHYNTFVPNPTRYPEFAKMVADLRAKDIRTILWVTQMINVAGIDFEPGGDIYDGPSPNYEEAFSCGWFVNDAGLYGWWKGTGSASKDSTLIICVIQSTSLMSRAWRSPSSFSKSL